MKHFVRNNERGWNLAEFIMYLAITGVLLVILNKGTELYSIYYMNSKSASFYTELDVINSYINKLIEEPYTFSYGTSELTIQTDKESLVLSNTKDGVNMTIQTLGEPVINKHFTYIRNFLLTPITKAVAIGNNGLGDMRYEIPVTNTIQIYFNTEPPDNEKLTWYREVLVYSFNDRRY